MFITDHWSFFYSHHKIVLKLLQKYVKAKRQQNRYIRATHFRERYQTAHATTRQTFDMQGRSICVGRDRPETRTVPQHQNLAQLKRNLMNKCNNFQQRFLFNCVYSTRNRCRCYPWGWGMHSVLMLRFSYCRVHVPS